MPPTSHAASEPVRATRIQVGHRLLVQPGRLPWHEPGYNWDGQPRAWPTPGPDGTVTTVRRVERDSIPLAVGTSTLIVIFTDHGVLACAPSRVLHQVT